MTTSGVQEETSHGEMLPDQPDPNLPAVLPSRRVSRLEKGEVVEVLPWEELIHKLDADGSTDGLPFMPEMLKYCGRQLTVTKRLERTCEDIEGGMRRIRNVVFLNDLRCDGGEHGGCQKGCCFLWKDTWLRTPKTTSISADDSAKAARTFPFAYKFDDQRYMCQATELVRATEYLSALDIRSYARDLRAKTYTPLEMLRLAFHALVQRTRFHVAGRSHRFLEGDLTKTPAVTLNLQPGEWVVVKNAEEITKTLNKEGKNRGLVFTAGMIPYCGRTFRVLNRLEKMIHEPTGKLIRVGGTVILENVICQGVQSLRGGCPKANYYYWREIWLKRV